MLIQLNTDGNIPGNEALAEQVEIVLTNALARFTQHITRLEVHLSDMNSESKKGAEDMRCLLEARLAGRQPTAVHHQAATLEQALTGAADKLKHSLESTL
ncbi:MAG: HPF/RaiA family ribosome-associated protein, partial [Gammaproteobacteria bacterium]